MNLRKIFDLAVANGASDIHIQGLLPPMMRIAGQMRSVESAPLSNDQIIDLIASIGPQMEKDQLRRVIFEGLDFSHSIEGLGRFRCSAYCHLGNVGIVMRVIQEKIPAFETLNLPGCIKDIALAQRGLTLVTGTTGSGKSTTLAAMIDLINNTYAAKIITIEDPVVLDMSEVHFLPSLSIGALVSLMHNSKQRQQRFMLIGLQPEVRQTLAVCRLDKVFEIYDTVETASQRLGQAS